MITAQNQTRQPDRPLKQFPQLLCGLLLLLYSLFFAVRAGVALLYPYGLEYGEGAVFSEAGQLFRQGFAPRALYTPNDMAPYQSAVYSPFFYYLQAFTMFFTGPQSLAGGRVISLLSTLGLVGVVFAVVYRYTARPGLRVGWWSALGAALTLPALPVVYGWGVLAKPDMTAIALSMAAVYLLWRGQGVAASGGWLYVLAGVICALAFLTKQSALAAPAAIAGWLLWQRRWRDLACFSGVATGVVLLAAGVFQWATSGTFFRHTVEYNAAQPFKPEIFTERYIYLLTTHPVLLALALVMFFNRQGPAGLSLWRVYFVTALLVAVSAGKVGSFNNYFIELLGIATVLAWVLTGQLIAGGLRWKAGPLRLKVSALVLLLLAVQMVLVLHVPLVGEGYFTVDYARATAIAAEVRRRAEAGPLLAEDSAWQATQDLPVEMNDPFAFGQLGIYRAWNGAPFYDQLNRGYFRTVMLDICKKDSREDLLDELVQSGEFETLTGRFDPQVLRIIKDRTRYTPARRIGCSVFLTSKN